MRIWLISLLSLPCLINAGGCGCEDVEKLLKWERAEDTKAHGCRTCTKNWGINENACPQVGYECNTGWAFTTNVLHSTDSCSCMEVRCAGTGRLAFSGKIVNKMRCNNSKWIIGEDIADTVVCAKPCDTGVCPVSTPKPASADFEPLKVSAATTESKCATAGCIPNNGMTIMNADGTPLVAIADTITQVKCSSDGWKIGENIFPYVMCNASPCGPSKCPAKVPGPGMTTGEVLPLTVKGNGKECATATCPGDYVRMNSDGTELGPLEPGTLTCKEDGEWKDGDDTTRPLVMCRQPLCKNRCDRTPAISTTLPTGTTMTIATRNDCTFSCPPNQALLRSINNGLAYTIETATCEASSQYRVGPPSDLVGQIGCYPCDFADGPLESSIGSVKAIVKNCIVFCPQRYTLQYYLPIPHPTITSVDRLYRVMFPSYAQWYEGVFNGENIPLLAPDILLECIPN